MTRFLRALFGFALIIVVFMIGLLTWQPGSVAYKDVVLYVAVIGAAYGFHMSFFPSGKGELLSSLQWVVSVVLFVTLVLTLYVERRDTAPRDGLTVYRFLSFQNCSFYQVCLKVLERICWLG